MTALVQSLFPERFDSLVHPREIIRKRDLEPDAPAGQPTRST